MEEEAKELTPKEKLFVVEYCKDFNKTQAALRAGYSEDSAGYIGYQNSKKLHIKQAIDERLAEMSLTPKETVKSISDIAKSSLNEFFTIRQTEFTPRIKLPLAEYVARIREEIDFEEEYTEVADLTEEEYDKHIAWKQQKEKEILRLEIELKRKPDAFRIVYGPTELIEEAVLDLVKIVRAQESGRIKSYSMTKDGPKIEMYAADAALRDLARVHGLFIDKVEHGADDSLESFSITVNRKKDEAKS